MDFEWKQRVIFTFVLAVPILALANPPPLHKQLNGIRWSKNPEKVRLLQEFQAAQRQRVEIQDNADEPEIPVCSTTHPDDVIPEAFDGRKYWKNCSSLYDIRDSGHCNAWAAAVASVLTDRFCISSNGSIQFRVSDQYLINCASNPIDTISSPCPYEDLSNVWKYIQSNGVVSGGYLNSQMGCQPTTVTPCEGNSSITCTSQPPSQEELGCQESCNNPTYGPSYIEDKKEITSVCRLPPSNDNSVDHIQHEIMKNGPVLAIMNLYSDLRQYNKSVGLGIYQNDHEAEERHTIHPVKIVGWGAENNTNYWIVANSWGYVWGDGGFFRVRMSQERPKWGAWITKNTVYCPTPNQFADISSSSLLQSVASLFKFL